MDRTVERREDGPRLPADPKSSSIRAGCGSACARSIAPGQFTVQISVKVSELLAGRVGMAIPPACSAVTNAGPVVAGQTAPPVTLPQLAVVQVRPVGAGSASTAPLAVSGRDCSPPGHSWWRCPIPRYRRADRGPLAGVLVLVKRRSALRSALVIRQSMSSPALVANAGHSCRVATAVPAPVGSTVGEPAVAFVQVDLRAVAGGRLVGAGAVRLYRFFELQGVTCRQQDHRAGARARRQCSAAGGGGRDDDASGTDAHLHLVARDRTTHQRFAQRHPDRRRRIATGRWRVKVGLPGRSAAWRLRCCASRPDALGSAHASLPTLPPRLMLMRTVTT